MTRVAVARGKFAKGLDGTGRRVPDAYEVLDIVDALTRRYGTDAHLVTYVIDGAARQPRINKTGLADAPCVPRVEAFFCDVDNADHAEWTDALRARAREQEEGLAVLASAGIYDTTHGRRIVQPLVEPVAADRVEPYLRRWLRELELAGLAVDWQCADWTRHFRLPHVRRAGRDFRSPRVALDRMRAIAIAPLPVTPASTTTPLAHAQPLAIRPMPAVDWTRELPPLWAPKVAQIANAVREVSTDWHSLFLAIAGALLARGAPHEHVPALCRAISLATCADTRTFDREAAARSTVERKLTGRPFQGFAALRRSHPAVAEAIDAALSTGANARARAQSRADIDAPAPSPLATTTAALEKAIRDAPDGLTLIAAECGLGKTQAAIRVAVQRANQRSVGAGACATRAPLGTKTSISVDKTALAIQVAGNLRRANVKVKRIFGPLSVRREDGTPECRLYDFAKPLVEGGQSLQRSFCEGGKGGPRCEFYETCRARAGFEGDEDARVIVAPHALLSVAEGEAGKTGLLVIDEPPDLLHKITFTLAQLDAALDARGMFAARYAAAMTPTLRAVRAWVQGATELNCAVELREVVRATASHVDGIELSRACAAAGFQRSDDAGEDVVACAKNALGPLERSTIPPIQPPQLFAARRALALARTLGAASKVFRALHFAMTTDARVAARVEDLGRERALVLTHARGDLARAVARDGATIVLDANVDLHAPVLEKVVGYAPPVHRFTATDGAPVKRTFLRTRKATRQRWLVSRRLVVDAGAIKLLRQVFEWAREDPDATEIGLVTFRPLALAIALARGECNEASLASWLGAGQREATLVEVRQKLAPVLDEWRGTLRIGHYGAVRGLDAMSNVDAMVTLGDPWPHLGVVRHDIAFLDLTEPWNRRVEAMCRAELEQAHGRLRVVHRTRPARALHVGNVLPGGSGWCRGRVEMRMLAAGRPRNEATMSRDEVRAVVSSMGGIRASARQLECGVATLIRYVNGEREVPEALALELRRRSGAPEQPVDSAAE